MGAIEPDIPSIEFTRKYHNISHVRLGDDGNPLYAPEVSRSCQGNSHPMP